MLAVALPSLLVDCLLIVPLSPLWGAAGYETGRLTASMASTFYPGCLIRSGMMFGDQKTWELDKFFSTW